MGFTYTEKNGDKPIAEWLLTGIKEHAKKKYGIILDVRINVTETLQEEASK